MRFLSCALSHQNNLNGEFMIFMCMQFTYNKIHLQNRAGTRWMVTYTILCCAYMYKYIKSGCSCCCCCWS